MSLAEIAVSNLRCVEHAELALHPGHNLIWGGNGSGKTSLLEAIFLLGRGRSFRTRNSERLIGHGKERLVVFGRTAGALEQTLGIQVSRAGGTLARIGGTATGSLAELSQAFAVQVIDPGVHKLVEEGGHRRRRWMDWAVFHVEPQFVDTWVRYTRTLRQRNAALKIQPAQASAWDPELARLGELIAGTCLPEARLASIAEAPSKLSQPDAFSSRGMRCRLIGPLINPIQQDNPSIVSPERQMGHR